MKLKLLGLLALFVLGLATEAQAQTPPLYWQCREPTATREPGYCPVSATNPLPTTASGGGTSNVAVTAPLPAGTNNIGDVDVATLPALTAGTANIGSASQQGALPVGPTNLTTNLSKSGTWTAATGNTVNFIHTDTTYTPYICAVTLSYTGSTAAGVNSVQVQNQGGNSQTLMYTVPTPAAAGVAQLPITFTYSPCLQGAPTNFRLVLPAMPAGATDGAYAITGYALK